MAPARERATSRQRGEMVALSRLRQAWEPRILSILRIVTGLLFMEHGTQKIFNFPPRPNARAYELFTRPVAFLLSGEMAFAYFMSHAPRGFFPLVNSGETAILYCFTFLYFFAAGAGAWSLDQAFSRELTRRPAE